MTELDSNLDDLAAAEIVPQEKMVPQSKVSEIAGLARQQGRESVMKELAAQRQMMADAPKDSPKPGMSEEEIRRIVQETQRQSQEEQSRLAVAQKIVTDWVAKVQDGPKKYEDFEEKVAALELQTMPALVNLTNSVDNTMEVVYELAQNPEKADYIDSLIQKGKGNRAIEEMKKLSKSISKNQSVADSITTREPLSQIKRSTAGADNGEPTVAEMRKMAQYRG